MKSNLERGIWEWTQQDRAKHNAQSVVLQSDIRVKSKSETDYNQDVNWA